MKMKLFGSTLLVALAAVVAPAHAGIEEWRLGAVGNIRSDHGDIVEGKYDDANVEIEAAWKSPELLNLIGSPRPYAIASISTGDGVSFGGVGLLWRWEFADGWAFEPGFGYIIHNGEIDNPYPGSSPEGVAFEAEHQLLGSRDLFRSSFALERELGDHAGIQLYWEHMSHGQILDEGRNQGLDYVGVRFLYRLNADTANQ
ncbi:MAG: acyloxyacyl hydrolase [Hyphomonadaceae bacterium]